jgi:nucleoside phosphorylase
MPQTIFVDNFELLAILIELFTQNLGFHTIIFTGSAISSSSKSNGSAVVVMRKSAINNSLLDLTDASEKMARRGSVGSLDSGMSISFQSNSIFNNHQQCSQNNYRSPRVNGGPPKNNHNINH